jgi:CheY-like chemotaxis protein
MSFDERSASPRALIVEDQRAHAVLARQLLADAGFDEILVTDSVRSGVERAKKLLHRDRPYHPTLLVLDWMLPDKVSPSLEGIVLAAELVRAMDSGELHPAHIAVVTYSPTLDREQDALDVGCSLVLPKPLDEPKARRLRELVATSPPYPRTPAQRAAYQRILRYTAPTMELLYAGRPSTALVRWDVKGVGALLKAIILQDLPEPAMSAWVQERGGLHVLRSHLQRLPIEERELARLRELLFAQPGEDWAFYAAEMGWSKSSYYNLRERLFALFAEVLNDGALDQA